MHFPVLLLALLGFVALSSASPNANVLPHAPAAPDAPAPPALAPPDAPAPASSPQKQTVPKFNCAGWMSRLGLCTRRDPGSLPKPEPKKCWVTKHPDAFRNGGFKPYQTPCPRQKVSDAQMLHEGYIVDNDVNPEGRLAGDPSLQAEKPSLPLRQSFQQRKIRTGGPAGGIS